MSLCGINGSLYGTKTLRIRLNRIRFVKQIICIINLKILTFKIPIMLGCAFAIRRDFFHDLGEYDEGLEIWNGEQIELSLKLHLCGGDCRIGQENLISA